MATFTTICFAMTLLIVTNEAAPNQKFNLKIPDECRGKGFCSIKPEGYDEIQEMIDSLLTPTFIANNMDDRIGEPVNSEELSPKEDWHNCPYRKTVHYPTWYSDSYDSVPDLFIQSKFFRQPIEEIKCAKEIVTKSTEDSSVECFQDLDLRTFNMQSTCVTSEATRTLWVYDPKKGEPVPKAYNVSCCCTCNIARRDDTPRLY